MSTSAKSKTIISREFTLSTRSMHLILYVLFFLSGCAALIYQVMWQRMLFTAFGVDLASVTIVVSVFMFGLGIGGVIGGRIADLMPDRLLMAYIIIECCIVVFGLSSPVIIGILGSTLFANSLIMTAIASFIILVIPTLLMGATFPILVAHVNQSIKNIGDSVGSLYFANTMGGAMGAYMGGFVLMYSMDMAGAIYCAAFLNLSIAVSAFVFFREQL